MSNSLTRSEKHDKKIEEKERRKKIAEDNRHLIKADKRSIASTGIIYFDKDTGVIKTNKNEWLSFYRISFKSENNVMPSALNGIMRITRHFVSGVSEDFLTLIESGDYYSDVKSLISEDISKLSDSILESVTPMQFDEYINFTNSVLGIDKDKYSFATDIRKKTDMANFIYPSLTKLEPLSFSVDKKIGESFSVIDYYDSEIRSYKDKLISLATDFLISYEVVFLSNQEKEDYRRMLETQYNEKLSDRFSVDFLNIGIGLLLFSGSEETRKITESMMVSLFDKAGMYLIPDISRQKDGARNILSLGLTGRSIYRVLSVDKAFELWN